MNRPPPYTDRIPCNSDNLPTLWAPYRPLNVDFQGPIGGPKCPFRIGCARWPFPALGDPSFERVQRIFIDFPCILHGFWDPTRAPNGAGTQHFDPSLPGGCGGGNITFMAEGFATAGGER